MNNFFRTDLKLNNRWWHRLLKVLRFLSILIICIFYYIIEKPKYVGTIHPKGSVVERIPDNGYYKIGDVLKENEYLYRDKDFGKNIRHSESVFNKNKEVLQGNYEQSMDARVFCSKNREAEYLKDIKDKYNYKNVIHSTSIDGDVVIEDLERALRRIANPCVGIRTNDDNLIINSYDEIFVTGGYIYLVEECDYVKITFLRLLKILKIVAIYSIITLIIYYKGIVYIICGNPKKK